MPLLSVLLLVAFLLVVFPLRSIRRKAQFGSAGRATYGRNRPAIWWLADILFLAGFGLVLANPLSQIAAGTSALLDPGPAISVTASAGILMATLLSVWSQETMGASWRPDIGPAEEASLITTGPFRFTRNPNYMAMLAAAVCATLLAPTLIGLAGVLVLFCALTLTARSEEHILTRVFGTPYREYASRTGRFLPGIGRIGSERS